MPAEPAPATKTSNLEVGGGELRFSGMVDKLLLVEGRKVDQIIYQMATSRPQSKFDVSGEGGGRSRCIWVDGIDGWMFFSEPFVFVDDNRKFGKLNRCNGHISSKGHLIEGERIMLIRRLAGENE